MRVAEATLAGAIKDKKMKNKKNHNSLIEKSSKQFVSQSLKGLPTGYKEFLEKLKLRIRSAQIKASLSANFELIQLYWDIGCEVVERQQKDGWGASVIEYLSVDLQRAFPGMKGFSTRNIWRMRAFYLAYTGEVKILPQVVAELDGKNLPRSVAGIPWGHNAVIIEQVKDPVERIWYAQKILKYGWSRDILVLQIENDLYHRQGKALTNFDKTLPPLQSDLAKQTLKDPYIFDFLTLDTESREQELEKGLIDHLTKFLLELGVGFSFVGKQVHFEVGGEDFYIDLLFYHLKLRCYIVIELKAGAFKPEYAGKMNFYLNAADDLMRHPDDKPSIGLLLCKSKNRLIVEYALREIKKPIGVARWTTKIVKALPENLKENLPTIEQIEKELKEIGKTKRRNKR